MSEYEARLAPWLESFVDDLGDRKQRMLFGELRRIEEDPFPDSENRSWQGIGVDEKDWFSYRIGRSWIVVYAVDEDEQLVRVADVVDYRDAIDRGLL